MTHPVKVEQLEAGQAYPQKTVCQLPQILQAVDSLFPTDRSFALNNPPVSIHYYTNNEPLGQAEVSL